MHLVQNFGLIIWCCFLLIMLSFAADNEDADVIKHCMNSTNSTSCSLTYEHVYKSLTKNENSFNISHALYPEGGKPSFLVRVNVYGPNKTHNSIPARFLWSIHCLFSNVPALVLEVLSLGSIIVRSRTQELDVQIPAFCCNLSENIEKRKEMIQGFLTRALFELQDLAVSPNIRDPSLNTAQCVIQGYIGKFFDSPGNIRGMLLAGSLFANCAGHIFIWAIVDMRKNNRSSGRKIKNTVTAMCVSIHFLSVLCILCVIVACGLAFRFSEDFSLLSSLASVIIYPVSSTFFYHIFMHRLSFSFVNCKRGIKAIFWLLCTFGGHTICYISCWLVIGIRINPSWGLTIALFIISIFATFTYVVYLYLDVFYPNGYNMRELGENTPQDFLLGTYTLSDNRPNDNDDQNRVTAPFKFRPLLARSFCILGCTAVGSIFVVVILAGPSIGGQTSAADELLKTSSLYFITAFITWATLKKHASIDAPLQKERPQNAEGQDTDHHTGDHPGGEFGTLVENNYYYYHYYHGDRRVSYEHSYTFTRETRV